jgi:hypothetical protein
MATVEKKIDEEPHSATGSRQSPLKGHKGKPDFDFAIKMTMTGHFRKGGRPDKKPHSGTCSARPD